MAKKSKPTDVVRFVLTAVFIVIAIAFTYAAFKQGGEYRSRAAQTYTIVKSWEFTKDAEGWNYAGVSSQSVRDGVYGAFVADNTRTPLLSNVNVNTQMPFGIKKLQFRAMAGIGLNAIQNTAVAVPKPEVVTPPSFIMPVNVWILREGKSDYELVNKIMLNADNEFHEYEVTLPQSLGTLNIRRINIVFMDLKDNISYGVDWIRLVAIEPKTQ